MDGVGSVKVFDKDEEVVCVVQKGAFIDGYWHVEDDEE